MEVFHLRHPFRLEQRAVLSLPLSCAFPDLVSLLLVLRHRPRWFGDLDEDRVMLRLRERMRVGMRMRMGMLTGSLSGGEHVEVLFVVRHRFIEFELRFRLNDRGLWLVLHPWINNHRRQRVLWVPRWATRVEHPRLLLLLLNLSILGVLLRGVHNRGHRSRRAFSNRMGVSTHFGLIPRSLASLTFPGLLPADVEVMVVCRVRDRSTGLALTDGGFATAAAERVGRGAEGALDLHVDLVFIGLLLSSSPMDDVTGG